eukprot:PhF_6_TR26114/c1_g2_i3/m.36944
MRRVSCSIVLPQRSGLVSVANRMMTATTTASSLPPSSTLLPIYDLMNRHWVAKQSLALTQQLYQHKDAVYVMTHKRLSIVVGAENVNEKEATLGTLAPKFDEYLNVLSAHVKGLDKDALYKVECDIKAELKAAKAAKLEAARDVNASDEVFRKVDRELEDQLKTTKEALAQSRKKAEEIEADRQKVSANI